MIRAALVGIVLAASVLSGARAQDIVVRTAVQPQGPLVLGQQGQLFVDVLFPGEMPYPPRVATPRIPGAQVFRFETQATNIAERIAGAPYVGQRFEFDLYPRRAGMLAVPPAQVTLLDKAGDPAGTRLGTALSIPAIVPQGLDPSGPIVAADAMTLTERWTPARSAHAMQVGDALTRRVIRTVPGVPGLALAPLAFPAPPAVRVYREAPDLDDKVERGEVTGTRTDGATYIFERAGRFVLPGVTQPWWDLRHRAARVLRLPARTVAVAAAAAEQSPRASAGARWRIAVAVAGGVLLAGGVAAWLGRGVVRRWWMAWRQGPVAAERRAFRALRRSCRHAAPAETWRAWQAWNAVRADRGPIALELASAVAALEGSLFATGMVWRRSDAARLEQAAIAARRRRHARVPRAVLPPLNPQPEVTRT